MLLGWCLVTAPPSALAAPAQAREPGLEPVRLGQARAQEAPPGRRRATRNRPAREEVAPPADTQPAVILRTTEPVRLAFREHLGPYWTVGRVVSSVARELREAGRSGPIVVRYMEDPARTAPDRLVTRIGWFAEPGEAAVEGFRIEPVGEEELACSAGDARSVKPLQAITDLRNWVADRGYEPTGPVYEIHHPAEPGDSGPRVETCVAARPVGDAAVPVHTDTAPPPPVRLDPIKSRVEPDASGDDRVEVVIPIRLEPRNPPAAEPKPAEPAAAEPAAEQPVTPAEPSVADADPRRPAADSPPRRDPAAVEPAPAVGGAGRAPGAAGMGALLRAEDHEGVAALLIPANRAWGHDDCAFAGAVVTRIEALAGRLGGPMNGLAAACANRWNERCGAAGPALRVAFRLSAADPRSEEKRAVIRKIDGLMAAVGAGALTADALRSALGEALDGAAQLWE